MTGARGPRQMPRTSPSPSGYRHPLRRPQLARHPLRRPQLARHPLRRPQLARRPLRQAPSPSCLCCLQSRRCHWPNLFLHRKYLRWGSRDLCHPPLGPCLPPIGPPPALGSSTETGPAPRPRPSGRPRPLPCCHRQPRGTPRVNGASRRLPVLPESAKVSQVKAHRSRPPVALLTVACFLPVATLRLWRPGRAFPG